MSAAKVGASDPECAPIQLNVVRPEEPGSCLQTTALLLCGHTESKMFIPLLSMLPWYELGGACTDMKGKIRIERQPALERASVVSLQS
eukprot:3248536-Amphidinium_carterae.3